VRYSLSHVHRLRQHHSHVRCICVTTALPSFSLPLRVAECPSSLSVPPFPPSRFSPSLLGVPSPSLHGIPHGVPRVLESLQRRPPGVYAVPPFRRSLRQTGSIILSGPPPFQRRPHRPRVHHLLGPTALPRATPSGAFSQAEAPKSSCILRQWQRHPRMAPPAGPSSSRAHRPSKGDPETARFRPSKGETCTFVSITSASTRACPAANHRVHRTLIFFFQWSGGFSCTPRAVGPPDTGSRFCSAVT
jgi:hypothetical protein